MTRTQTAPTACKMECSGSAVCQNKGRGLTAAVITLGCKVNQCEGQSIAELFEKAGYSIIPFSRPADVYVINTCSVTAMAESKSRKLIHRAHTLNPDALVIITGCYSQRVGGELFKLPGVKIIAGNAGKSRLTQLAEAYFKSKSPIQRVSDISLQNTYEELPLSRHDSRTRGYIKIQDGCQNYCAYCIIPYVRGPSRSRPLAAIISEGRRLADMGYKELVLGGIQLSAYGPDLPDKPDLADVIEQLSGIEGISRIRLGSLEPLLINDEFVRRLRKCESLCPQFHLSLQSGSDSVLKRMNRKYNTNEYEGAVACLRENYDNPAITTDIIVGFPGETQEEFEQTQAFMQKIGFASVHVFAYSRRAGTAADNMPGQISPEVKKERSHVLLEQAAKDSLGYCQSFEGKIRPVLFETFKANVLKGLTPEHLEVRVISDINLAGEIRDVRLTCGQDGLTGELLV